MFCKIVSPSVQMLVQIFNNNKGSFSAQTFQVCFSIHTQKCFALSIQVSIHYSSTIMCITAACKVISSFKTWPGIVTVSPIEAFIGKRVPVICYCQSNYTLLKGLLREQQSLTFMMTAVSIVGWHWCIGGVVMEVKLVCGWLGTNLFAGSCGCWNANCYCKFFFTFWLLCIIDECYCDFCACER